MQTSTAFLFGASLSAAIAIVACNASNKSSSQGAHAEAASIARNDATRFAYGVGYQLGGEVRAGLAADGLSASPDLVVEGFRDALSGGQPKMPKQELDRTLRAVHRAMADRSAQVRYASEPEFKALADRNATESKQAMDAFYASGAKEIEPGVAAQTVQAGRGESLANAEVIIADWTLTTRDGRVVDQRTDGRMEPGALLPVAEKVLRKMHVGDRWKVGFSADQAFGLGGDAPAVGPNEALFIDITIRGIAPQEAGR